MATLPSPPTFFTTPYYQSSESSAKKFFPPTAPSSSSPIRFATIPTLPTPNLPPAYPPPPPFPYAHYPYPHPQPLPGFFTPPPPGFYPFLYAPPYSPHPTFPPSAAAYTPSPTYHYPPEPNWPPLAPDSAPNRANNPLQRYASRMPPVPELSSRLPQSHHHAQASAELPPRPSLDYPQAKVSYSKADEESMFQSYGSKTTCKPDALPREKHGGSIHPATPDREPCLQLHDSEAKAVQRHATALLLRGPAPPAARGSTVELGRPPLDGLHTNAFDRTSKVTSPAPASIGSSYCFVKSATSAPAFVGSVELSKLKDSMATSMVPSSLSSISTTQLELISSGTHGTGSGHDVPIRRWCVSNLTEQNSDEKPPVFDVYSDETEEGADRSDCTLPAYSPLERAVSEPLFDVYNDETEVCSVKSVDVFTLTLGHKLYEEDQQDSERLAKSFHKTPGIAIDKKATDFIYPDDPALQANRDIKLTNKKSAQVVSIHGVQGATMHYDVNRFEIEINKQDVLIRKKGSTYPSDLNTDMEVPIALQYQQPLSSAPYIWDPGTDLFSYNKLNLLSRIPPSAVLILQQLHYMNIPSMWECSLEKGRSVQWDPGIEIMLGLIQRCEKILDCTEIAAATQPSPTRTFNETLEACPETSNEQQKARRKREKIQITIPLHDKELMEKNYSTLAALPGNNTLSENEMGRLIPKQWNSWYHHLKDVLLVQLYFLLLVLDCQMSEPTQQFVCNSSMFSSTENTNSARSMPTATTVCIILRLNHEKTSQVGRDEVAVYPQVQFGQPTSELSLLSLTTCIQYATPKGINSVPHASCCTIQHAGEFMQNNYHCYWYCMSAWTASYNWDPSIDSLLLLYNWLQIHKIRRVDCSVIVAYDLVSALWPLTKIAVQSYSNIEVDELISRYHIIQLHQITSWTGTTYNAITSGDYTYTMNLLMGQLEFNCQQGVHEHYRTKQSSEKHLQESEMKIIYITFRPP